MESPGKKAVLWRGLIIFLAVAIAAGGFFWLSQSTLLAVENIEVEGNRAIPTEEVMSMAGPLLRGETLLRPSFGEVSELILSNPFAESVEVERDFPHTIRIRIRERRAFVNLRTEGNKVVILSSDNMGLAAMDNPASSLPVLITREPCPAEVGKPADCQDVQTGLLFLSNIPVTFNQEFAEVSVADGDINARTVSGVKIHFGSLDDYGLKFEVLRQMLARSVSSGADISVDVSVPERPVTKDNTPMVTTPPEEAPEEPVEEAPAEPLDETAVETPVEDTLEAAPDPAAGEALEEQAAMTGETAAGIAAAGGWRRRA